MADGRFGAIGSNLTMAASQSVRRNAANDAFEAFTPAGGISLLDVYPIGAIYISVDDTTPDTLFGGTWSAIGAGRVLVGIDAGDVDFDTVEEPGGAKTSTPDAHAVTQPSAHSNHVFTQPSAHSNHVFTQSAAHAAKNTDAGADSALHPSGTSGTHVAAATHAHNITQYTHSGGAVDAHSAHANGAVDAHSAHADTAVVAHAAMSIVQPYLVVYMWKRTA